MADAVFSDVPVTIVDQLSRELPPRSRASFAIPTHVPVRKETLTASTANGINSLRERADAMTAAEIKPVQRPRLRVLETLGSSAGWSS